MNGNEGPISKRDFENVLNIARIAACPVFAVCGSRNGPSVSNGNKRSVAKVDASQKIRRAGVLSSPRYSVRRRENYARRNDTLSTDGNEQSISTRYPVERYVTCSRI